MSKENYHRAATRVAQSDSNWATFHHQRIAVPPNTMIGSVSV